MVYLTNDKQTERLTETEVDSETERGAETGVDRKRIANRRGR